MSFACVPLQPWALQPLFDLQMQRRVTVQRWAPLFPTEIYLKCVCECVVNFLFTLSASMDMWSLCIHLYLHLTACRACMSLSNAPSSKRVCETWRQCVREGLTVKEEGWVLGRQQVAEGEQIERGW